MAQLNEGLLWRKYAGCLSVNTPHLTQHVVHSEDVKGLGQVSVVDSPTARPGASGASAWFCATVSAVVPPSVFGSSSALVKVLFLRDEDQQGSFTNSG